MAMQIRPRGGQSSDKWYSPDRDLLYIFFKLVKQSLDELTDSSVEERKWLEKLDIDHAGFSDVAVALSNFFNNAVDPAIPEDQIIPMSEFNEIPIELRAAFANMLLRNLMRSYVGFIRNASLGQLDVDEVVESMKEAEKRVNSSVEERKWLEELNSAGLDTP